MTTIHEEPQQPRLMMGLAGALVTGLAGMIAWYGLTIATNTEFGYAAWGLGALVGFITLKAARMPSILMGVIAGACAALAIVGGGYLTVSHFVDAEITKGAESNYTQEMAMARRVVDAKSEADIRLCLAWIDCDEGQKPNPAAVPAGKVDAFDNETRPHYQSLLNGKPSRDEYVKSYSGLVRASIPATAMLKDSLSPWTALWLLLGVSTAFTLAGGLSRKS